MEEQLRLFESLLTSNVPSASLLQEFSKLKDNIISKCVEKIYQLEEERKQFALRIAVLEEERKCSTARITQLEESNKYLTGYVDEMDMVWYQHRKINEELEERVAGLESDKTVKTVIAKNEQISQLYEQVNALQRNINELQTKMYTMERENAEVKAKMSERIKELEENQLADHSTISKLVSAVKRPRQHVLVSCLGTVCRVCKKTGCKLYCGSCPEHPGLHKKCSALYEHKE